MSKQGTSRSRADRTRGTASVVVPVSSDIVPGKFTENDLNMSVEQENIDEYIFFIVENIIQDTEKIIKDKYYRNRIVPFTVNLAKIAMLKIVEWNFLCHDEGESNNMEEVWNEDEEPESCTIDSWAQGYFPKRQATMDFGRHPKEQEECILEENSSRVEDSEEEIEESLEKLDIEVAESEYTGDVEKLSNKEKDIEPLTSECQNIEEVKINEISTNHESKENFSSNQISKPKPVFKPYRGKLNFDDLNMLTETLSETEQRLEMARLKNEAKLLRGTSSKSTNREIGPVDYEKKVIQKLFGTSVKGYQQLKSTDILLNTSDQLVALMKIPGNQSTIQRVKANHKMLEILPARNNLSSTKESSMKKKAITSYRVGLSRQDEFRGALTPHDKHPLPASMLDSIDPVPGVIVQEGDRTKKSINRKLDPEHEMEKEFLGLRPVKNRLSHSSYMIQDIINVNQVNIKPIISSAPIPPIPDGYKTCD